jgi:hypothetical protein
MNVVWTSQLLWDTDSYLSYIKQILNPEQKEIGRIECLLVFGNKEMLEYQKELFMDTLSDLVGGMQQEYITFEKIQQLFELALQDLNVRLGAFGEKMQEKWPFAIHGVLQVFWENQYIASLIGHASVVVLRKNHIHYWICQWIADPRPRIDRFNELLEGELKADDQLIVLGVTLETYLDKQDMQTVIEQAHIQDLSIEETLLALLTTRIDKEKIWFLWNRLVEETPLFAEYRMWRGLLRLRDRFGGKFSYFKKFQHVLLYAAMWLLTLVLLTWIVESFISSTNQTYTTDANGVAVDISIEDIQKDISTFKRIDPSSEQKIKKYNEIVAQLDLLERNKKWTVDVKKLRGILEKDYLEWFNIESILDLDQWSQLIYTFTQLEKNTFGQLKGLYWNNGIFVAGSDGALINALDDQVRGTLVSAWLQRKIETCSLNLLRNGLYCYMNDGNMFNILRAWLQPMSSSDESSFGVNINAVGIFWNTNFYTLKNPPSSISGENSFAIFRYTNQRGSQELFWPATRYEIQPDPAFQLAASGVQTLSIDGTFLVWSPVSASLWQLWRPGAEPKLLVRQVPILGGDTFRAPGKNSKIFASVDARFVYIWDKENQTFTVYRSTPFKTNTAHTTDYSLPYFFSIKFTLGDIQIQDVFVEEWEKANLYIMTNDQVRKISLSELRDRFFAKEEAATQ